MTDITDLERERKINALLEQRTACLAAGRKQKVAEIDMQLAAIAKDARPAAERAARRSR